MIEIQDISMNYGPVKAVDRASFSVKKGEILGLLGPNGAGKSTIMKIITTYITPSSGKVVIDGIDTGENPIAVREKIGYLPETAPLYTDMLTCDYLSFVAKARGMEPARLQERMEWVVQACGLKGVFKKTIVELSRGYRQRVGLAQALIHDPDVIILDEPTSGLDPIQIIDIRSLIKSLAKEKTVIFSTHILQEVTAVSDRVVIINEGKIIADGTKEELERRSMKQNRSWLSVEADKEEVEEKLREVEVLDSVTFLASSNGLSRFELRYDFQQPVWRELDRVIKDRGWPLKSYGEIPITFEEAFIELTRESKKGGEERRV